MGLNWGNGGGKLATNHLRYGMACLSLSRNSILLWNPDIHYSIYKNLSYNGILNQLHPFPENLFLALCNTLQHIGSFTT
jgi:hypothetical protein